MIDIKKQYRTRDGREVRIYATDGRGDWPVHGAVKNEDGWNPTIWRVSGRWSTSENMAGDLIEVKPRIKREVWVNVFDNSNAFWSTQEEADKMCGKQRIACVRLTIDCEEGEGL